MNNKLIKGEYKINVLNSCRTLQPVWEIKSIRGYRVNISGVDCLVYHPVYEWENTKHWIVSEYNTGIRIFQNYKTFPTIQKAIDHAKEVLQANDNLDMYISSALRKFGYANKG